MPVLEKLLILAMAAQAFLAIGLVVWLGFERVPRIARGEVKMADIAVDKTGYPLRARLLSNSFDNQFQLPVLFLVGALLLLQLDSVTWVDVALGWLFVVLRFAHAGVHVTTNHIPRRFIIYTAGLAVLSLFWLWLALRIILAPGI